MTYYVSNCGIDERGRISGGQAGDQTGREYRVRTWYDYNQDQTARHPDERVRYLIAKLAVESANNDNIGYDQGERTTMWEQLRKVGFDPTKIATPCEADCSASTAAIVKAVGFLVDDAKLQGVSPHMWTGIEREQLQRAGFTIITGNSVLDPSRLLPGDIQFNNGHHTNIFIGEDPAGPQPPKKKGRRKMECILGIKGKNTLVWFDGTNINDLSGTACLDAVQAVAKAVMDEELPRVDLTEEQFARFCQALKGGYPKHLKKIVEKYPTRSPEGAV